MAAVTVSLSSHGILGWHLEGGQIVALIVCSECEHNISEYASSCPNCGNPNNEKSAICSECEQSDGFKNGYCSNCGNPRNIEKSKPSTVKLARPSAPEKIGLARLPYFLYSVFSFVIFCIPFAVVATSETVNQSDADMLFLWFWIGLVIFMFVTAKRLKNAGLNSWLSLLLILPLLNAIIFCVALFKSANNRL